MLFLFKYSKYFPILFKYFDHELDFDDDGEKQTQTISKWFSKRFEILWTVINNKYQNIFLQNYMQACFICYC